MVRVILAMVILTGLGARCSAGEGHPPGKARVLAKIPVAGDLDPVPFDPVARLRREGIRAMSRGRPDKMQAAGFNLVLPWQQVLEDARKAPSPDSDCMVRPDGFSAEAVRELRDWALQCKRHDQIMMHMMYVGAESSVRCLAGIEGDLLRYVRTGKGAERVWPAHHYRHLMDWNGATARWAPCPLERRYWMGLIRPQLELVARTLNATGATGGGALELETYCFYSIYPGMASQKSSFCYCDHCFGCFVDSLDGKSQASKVPPGRRFDWLTQRGLLPKYERYLEDHLADLVREMMSKVRKIRPNFLFGFYPYAPFWYYDALIRGGGSVELPCLVFPSAEYDGGYIANAPSTFFGDASTPASLQHIRRRGLPALYAGGLWAKTMNSAEAVTLGMDRLLRGVDGFWIYKDYEIPDRLWRQAKKMNRWSAAHPEPLPQGSLTLDALASAVARLAQHPRAGLSVVNHRIVARYTGGGVEVPLFEQSTKADHDYSKNWSGRGDLPSLDRGEFHSVAPSIRFAPSRSGNAPISPYIDHRFLASQAVSGQDYELSFWVQCRGAALIRFWVGRANSAQYPAYMYYRNFVLQPGRATPLSILGPEFRCTWPFAPRTCAFSRSDQPRICQPCRVAMLNGIPNRGWQRLRVDVRYKDNPPLVVRFWTPPTDGTVWLDDIRLWPVQERVVEVPLTPPAGATGWGTVDWQLTPADARCEAEIIDPVDGHLLRSRLYSGDNLAPFDAVVGLRPVRLRLQVHPSAEEPVTLESVRVRFRG